MTNSILFDETKAQRTFGGKHTTQQKDMEEIMLITQRLAGAGADRCVTFSIASFTKANRYPQPIGGDLWPFLPVGSCTSFWSCAFVDD